MLVSTLEQKKINTKIERRILQTLSGHGKSKGNYDTSLDENMISNIDIEKTNEIKKDDDNIKLQNNKSKANDKKIG